jgi:RHS repeat-associated protein
VNRVATANTGTWSNSALAQATSVGTYGKANQNAITNRGFTGHEPIDEVGIIHMNGRIYDATLGRFLQADPVLQDPQAVASFNRYSYVWNNPLNSTDPSGYLKILRKAIKSLSKVFGAEVVNFFGSLAFGYFGGPLGAALWSYEFARAHGVSASDALKGAAIAFVSSQAYTNIGQSSLSFPMKVLAHGVVGGVTSYAQGGKFWHGFLSAGVTKALNINGMYGTQQGFGHTLARVSMAAIIGGTVSEATGGKFANGAKTAALAQLFNGEGEASRAEAAKNAQKGQLTHEYEFETEVCSRSASACTADNVWGVVKDNSVPFQDGRLTDGTVSKIPVIGTVTTRVDDSSYTLVNQTHDDHLFRHGTVTRSLVVSETTISVRTVGTGINTNRFTQGANYVASPYFKALDANIKATIGVQQFRNDVKSFFD